MKMYDPRFDLFITLCIMHTIIFIGWFRKSLKSHISNNDNAPFIFLLITTNVTIAAILILMKIGWIKLK